MKQYTPKKFILTLLGWLSFSLGVVGIFLPLMPTTVFWIIAVWLWAKSSPQFVNKVYEHPKYGKSVKAFMQQGIVSRKAKYYAVSSMAVSYILLLTLMNNGITANAVVAIILTIVALWLVTRSETERL